jgi:hypothetical protein
MSSISAGPSEGVNKNNQGWLAGKKNRKGIKICGSFQEASQKGRKRREDECQRSHNKSINSVIFQIQFFNPFQKANK